MKIENDTKEEKTKMTNRRIFKRTKKLEKKWKHKYENKYSGDEETIRSGTSEERIMYSKYMRTQFYLIRVSKGENKKKKKNSIQRHNVYKFFRFD